MSTPIYPQYISSQQLNTPQMTGGGESAVGQILKVLDAALITGCCPNSVANISIVGNYIKLNFGVAHGYLKYQFITLEGASSPLLNKSHRIQMLDTTSVSILKGDISDLSGSITAKISPLGWESIFGNGSATKRAYRSKDITSTRTVLYLDCELKGAGYAQNPIKKAVVNMCRDMTTLGEQVDSYTSVANSAPTDGELHWFQAVARYPLESTSSRTSNWVIVGDGKLFYFFINNAQYQAGETLTKGIYMFGDLPKTSPEIQYNCVLFCSRVSLPTNNAATYTSVAHGMGSYMNGGASTAALFTKDLEGLLPLEQSGWSSNLGAAGAASGRGGFSTSNPLQVGYIFSPVISRRLPSRAYGGTFPYIKGVASDFSFAGSSLDGAILGTHLLVCTSLDNQSSFNPCYIGVDLFEERQEDEV